MKTQCFTADQTYFGFEIFCYCNDVISDEIETKGYFSLEEVLLLDAIIKRIPDAVCFDVGANIGLHSLGMCQHAAQVFSFEPQHTTTLLLEKNIHRNNASNCTVNQFGLSNVTETKTLYINKSNNGGSSVEQTILGDADFRTEEICLQIGDDFVTEQNITKLDVIKVDVEGLEGEVLMGLKDTITQHQPIIFLEWNNDRTRDVFTRFDIFKKLLPTYHAPLAVNNSCNKFLRTTKKKYLRFINRYLFKRFTKNFKIVLEDVNWLDDYSCIILFPEDKLSLLESAVLDVKLPNSKYKKFWKNRVTVVKKPV